MLLMRVMSMMAIFEKHVSIADQDTISGRA